MPKLKKIDFRILSELLQNSKRSDRDLAREIGVSQPTVTRRRVRLEKEAIDNYTFIPKWTALGYKILGITLIKTHSATRAKDRDTTERERARRWLSKRPQILLGCGCNGFGSDAIMMSVHRSYAEYDGLLHELRRDLGDTIDDVQSMLVNLGGSEVLKPLGLKYLADAE